MPQIAQRKTRASLQAKGNKKSSWRLSATRLRYRLLLNRCHGIGQPLNRQQAGARQSRGLVGAHRLQAGWELNKSRFGTSSYVAVSSWRKTLSSPETIFCQSKDWSRSQVPSRGAAERGVDVWGPARDRAACCSLEALCSSEATGGFPSAPASKSMRRAHQLSAAEPNCHSYTRPRAAGRLGTVASGLAARRSVAVSNRRSPRLVLEARPSALFCGSFPDAAIARKSAYCLESLTFP
jgi:hypothetical protein